MRKLLSLSLGLFAAATSFAGVQTVTIPAIPDGNKTCSFVIEKIQMDSTISKQWESPLNKLIGKTFLNDTTIVLTNADAIADDGEIDTLKCNISTGTRPSVIANDTAVCYKEFTEMLALAQFNSGSYWSEDPISGKYIETRSSHTDMGAFHIYQHKGPSNGNIDTTNIDSSNLSFRPDTLLLDSVVGPITFLHQYFYSIEDTITGCHTGKMVDIEIKDCGSGIIWQNYSGPKEYNDYRYEDAIPLFDLDTVIALDPSVNCICPLPLDTIIETNRMRDPEVCGYYKYDVTVKLVAHLGEESDTIVYYIMHLDDSGSRFDVGPDFVPAKASRNCTYTVPELFIALPDCICGSYYYSVNLHEGDTITQSTDLIYTFKNFCTGNTYDTVHIYVPERKDRVSISGGDTSVYAKDSVVLCDLITVHSYRLEEDLTHPRTYNLVQNSMYEVSYYKDSISDSTLLYDPLNPGLYGNGSIRKTDKCILDDVKKSGEYYFVAIDTVTGCSDTLREQITVLGSSDSPLLYADLYEQRGDIYTVSGVLVAKDVILKEVMDRLNEGLYIFNKQKIYIRKK